MLFCVLLVAMATTPALGTLLCDLSDVCSCDLSRGKVDCSCLHSSTKELTLDAASLPSNAASLRLSSCRRVTLTAGSISAPPFLRRVDLEDVGDLAVLSYGLARPQAGDATREGTALALRRCNVSRLEGDAFRGRLDDVELRDCHVSGVAPYAFASLEGTERLRLFNCTVRGVQPRAFRRFSVAHLVVRGGTFPDGLPGRAFTDVDATHSFRLEGVALGRLDTWAFVVGGAVPDFALVDCDVHRVETHAFNVSVGGATLVRGNSFASLAAQAFGAVTADRDSRVAGDVHEVLFEDNAVENLERGALDVGDGAGVFLTVRRLRVGGACTCDAWEASRRPPPAEEVLCGEERLVDYRAAHCEDSASSGDLWIALGVALPLGALLLAAPCVCLWLVRRRRGRRRGKHSLVLPQAKTYRETELHVFLEKAEPLVGDADTK